MRFLEDGTGCVVFEGLLGFVNAILSVTVFATPYWQETSYSDSNGAEAVRHSGLWQNCSATTCTMIPVMAPVFLIGARVFMSVAVLTSLLAVVLALSRMWHRAKLLFAVGTCYTVQVIFHLLGLASYIMGQERGHVGWTYLVGCVTLVVTALCMMCSFGQACCLLRTQLAATSQPSSPPLQKTFTSSYTPLSHFEASGSTSSEGEN